MQEWYILKMAAADGKPMYCLISALHPPYTLHIIVSKAKMYTYMSDVKRGVL